VSHHMSILFNLWAEIQNEDDVPDYLKCKKIPQLTETANSNIVEVEDNNASAESQLFNPTYFVTEENSSTSEADPNDGDGKYIPSGKTSNKKKKREDFGCKVGKPGIKRKHRDYSSDLSDYFCGCGTYCHLVKDRGNHARTCKKFYLRLKNNLQCVCGTTFDLDIEDTVKLEKEKKKYGSRAEQKLREQLEKNDE